MSQLSQLPSVDQLLQTSEAASLAVAYGHPLTLEAIRAVLDELRQQRPLPDPLPDRQGILSSASEKLSAWTRPSLQPVINASGVILHTNLGRAPLSQAALRAIQDTCQGYNNLEYDLPAGKRGSRLVHAEALLTHLTGAEAALVVNNNAAAVLLALTGLAHRRRAIISRTQLVEIGGGFRVPDVMNQSGAKLVEIGATNRVHLSDYALALEEPAALVVRAHHSNFRIIGFTSEPHLAEIAALSHQKGVPLMDDLGSGALLDTARYGLGHEPMVQESLVAKADVVCFSGDKLLGGPQAGIILGRADLLARLKRHPLARALRADKLCLAALSATLLHYLKDEAEREIPVWQMISRTPDILHEAASRWVSSLGQGEVVRGESTVGGGSLPEETLPTFLLALTVSRLDRFMARLRSARQPIIGRVLEGKALFDPRTVLPHQETALLEGLQSIINN
jgi:L-seryl-tRNA(Ser) seleniumtransferase